MSHSIEHCGLFVDFGMITIGSHKFIELETKVNHTMPTLRWAIGPHQWESFHLDKKSCLIYIGKIVLNYIHCE